jgi:hypothetical protein
LARLILIFHAVECWEVAGGVVPEAQVSAATVERAIRFAYFLLRHSQRFYTTYTGGGGEVEEARKIAAYLLTHPTVTEITPRGIGEFRKALRDDRRLLFKAARELEIAAWFEAKMGPEGPVSWRVKQKIHERYAKRAERERRERAQIRENIERGKAAWRRLNGME